MNCPYPHCTREDSHDGEHDTNRIERIWESGKLLFSILGAAGYAGFLASMHFTLAIFSLSLVGATGYGIYRLLDVQK